MRYLIILLAITISLGKVIGNNIIKIDTAKWKANKAKLTAVYVDYISNSKEDVLKLYSDKTFEFISYNYTFSGCNMRYNTGNYTINGSKLKLNKPKEKDIRSDLFGNTLTIVPDRGIYTSKFNSVVMKGKFLFKRDKNKDYKLPFYIDPRSKTIVNNKEAVVKIDLKDLIIELNKNITGERNKAKIITEFIHNSISYDYVGYQTHNYKNNQKNMEEILAGKNRLAVCAGYSYLFQELCSYAGLNCREICGYVRNSSTDLGEKGGYHAWNIITIDGKEEIWDVTWADNGKDYWINVDPALMIFTHYPDKKENQLLSNTITNEEFLNSTIIFPRSTNYKLLKEFPVANTHNIDSFFVFTTNADLTHISISTIDGKHCDNYYSMDETKNKSYSHNSIVNYTKKSEGKKTQFYIPISSIVSIVSININGCNYNYKIIKGDRNVLYKHYRNSANKVDIEPYLRGVVSCILLNDASKLSSLVGSGNKTFFTNENTIKKELITAFANWDGSLSTMEISTVYSYTFHGEKKIEDTKPEVRTEKSVRAGKREFVFDKVNNSYEIIACR